MVNLSMLSDFIDVTGIATTLVSAVFIVATVYFIIKRFEVKKNKKAFKLLVTFDCLALFICGYFFVLSIMNFYFLTNSYKYIIINRIMCLVTLTLIFGYFLIVEIYFFKKIKRGLNE